MRQHALSLALLLASGCGSALPPEKELPPPVRAPLAPPLIGKAAAAPAGLPDDDGATLVVRGAPPIPPALRERLNRYLETRWAKLEALSDDGKSALVTTRFAQTPQAHVLSIALGARKQLTFESEPVGNLSFVPGGGGAFLFARDRGGDEQFQIYRHDPVSAETSLLTDGKSRHGPYVWSWDGSRIAYTSNARNGKDMDLYLGDGKTQSAGKLLLERSGHWYPIEFSRDGKRLLAAEYVSINDSRLYTIDVASRDVVRVTPEHPVASYRAAAFDPTGTRIYTASDRDGEFVELFQVELASDRWKPLSREIRWNVEAMALSPDGATLAFVTNEDGWGVLRLLDTRSGKQRPASNLPKGLVSGLSFARKSGTLGFSLAGPGEPGDAYSYELATGKLTRWTESEIGGLDRSRFVTPSLVHYDSFDGRKIPAFYYRPRSEGPHPVLIWIHGGPEAQSRPSFQPLLQYLLAESQIAVLVPNVRGSDGYGKSYLLLDNGKQREDSVRDIGSLLDWVGRQKELDGSRVAVMGGSYGGYMVLASLVHFAGRLVAGIDVVGIGNFVTFLENTKDYRRDLRRAEYGDERDPEMRAFLQRISPTTNAAKIKSHLFVAHGANDPRVPLSETDQIVAAVQQQGRDVWYMVAKNEGHGFQKKDNRDTFTLLSVLFLEKHLGRAR
jgi:dipeptidyl aminopeptidase/acylaminoacyl peptidase